MTPLGQGGWEDCPRCGARRWFRCETNGRGGLVEKRGPCRCPRGATVVSVQPSATIEHRKDRRAKQVLVPKKRVPTKRGQHVEEKLQALFKAGSGFTETVKLVGCSKATARRVRDELKERGELPPCGCGREGGHPFMCSFRRNGSTARRRYLQDQLRIG